VIADLTFELANGNSLPALGLAEMVVGGEKFGNRRIQQQKRYA